MSFGYGYMTSRDDRTEREKELEWELEEARRRQEEQQENERQQREERMRGIQERAFYAARTAGTWPEALNAQGHLFRAESTCCADDPEFPDDYFGPGAEACEQAAVYWPEEEARVADQIAELERQIEELRDGIRHRVADRLDEHEGKKDGWYSLANALREIPEDSNELSRWLNW